MKRFLAAVLALLIATGVIGHAGAQPHALPDLYARLAGYPEMTIRLTDWDGGRETEDGSEFAGAH
jgi:hypothetical protein